MATTLSITSSAAEDDVDGPAPGDRKKRQRSLGDDEGAVASTASPANVGLAFASISTDDFKFDPAIAAQVLAGELEWVFPRLPQNVRVVLVDPIGKVGGLVVAQLPETMTSRLLLASTFSMLEQGCSVVAVGGIKLLRSGGDRINIELHRAFGSGDELAGLLREAVKGKKAVEIGKPVIVHLGADHPITKSHGVTHLISVLGPNMNPSRLDDLKGDYAKGKLLLQNAYRAMFESFLRIVTDREADAGTSSADLLIANNKETSLRNANFQWDIPPYSAPSRTPPRLPGLSLHPYLAPSPAADYRVFVWFRTEEFVIIYDGYPKARYHALVIPANRSARSLRDLTSRDAEWVATMHRLGRAMAEKMHIKCQIGYHAVPSLTPLHLHVISRDLSSPRLTTKKHWNSFTHPDLFIPADYVEQQLTSDHGRVQLKALEELHEAELSSPKCYVCGLRPSGTLKDMLQTLRSHKCSRCDDDD